MNARMVQNMDKLAIVLSVAVITLVLMVQTTFASGSASLSGATVSGSLFAQATDTGDGDFEIEDATGTDVMTATPVPTPTSTPAPDDFVLHIVEPVEAETLTTNPTLLVSGRTRVDAVVTVNDTFVDPDIDGRFSAEIPLDEGPNFIEVVASIATGEELSTVLVVIYEP